MNNENTNKTFTGFYTIGVNTRCGWRSERVKAVLEQTSEKMAVVKEVLDIGGNGNAGYASRTGAKRQEYNVSFFADREIGKRKRISSIDACESGAKKMTQQTQTMTSASKKADKNTMFLIETIVALKKNQGEKSVANVAIVAAQAVEMVLGRNPSSQKKEIALKIAEKTGAKSDSLDTQTRIYAANCFVA